MQLEDVDWLSMQEKHMEITLKDPLEIQLFGRQVEFHMLIAQMLGDDLRMDLVYVLKRNPPDPEHPNVPMSGNATVPVKYQATLKWVMQFNTWKTFHDIQAVGNNSDETLISDRRTFIPIEVETVANEMTIARIMGQDEAHYGVSHDQTEQQAIDEMLTIIEPSEGPQPTDQWNGLVSFAQSQADRTNPKNFELELQHDQLA